MPLTPEDVHDKRFTPVRLREGYDMGEVDQFLDEVESELERLIGESTELRSQLEAASGGQPPVPSVAMPAPEPVAVAEPEPEPAAAAAEPEPVEAPEPVPPPVPVPPTIGEASSAAARLLEIATRNADEVVAEAKEQADSILTEVRARTERLDQESRTKADRMESDARSRAEQLDDETANKRQELFGQLERDRDALSAELEHLRSFEREYRSRLKSYFSAQLAHLEGEQEPPASLSDGDGTHPPQRLRSLLGEDQNEG